MKLIAHRGASLCYPENTIESLMHGAQLGAYAVECDVRKTRDGVFVIFHDPDMKRLAGQEMQVGALSLEQMRNMLAAHGKCLLTLDDLSARYSEKAYVLLHIKLDEPDDELIQKLKAATIPLILGVSSLRWLRAVSVFTPPERVLGFIPTPQDRHEFAKAGAGILRLWENWLHDILPETVQQQTNAQVFIMCRDSHGSMNGSAPALDWFAQLGADGVLLNDIELGAEWLQNLRGGYSR
jgi:Glycerophosphoryl diester phosphodiesterase